MIPAIDGSEGYHSFLEKAADGLITIKQSTVLDFIAKDEDPFADFRRAGLLQFFLGCLFVVCCGLLVAACHDLAATIIEANGETLEHYIDWLENDDIYCTPEYDIFSKIPIYRLPSDDPDVEQSSSPDPFDEEYLTFDAEQLVWEKIWADFEKCGGTLILDDETGFGAEYDTDVSIMSGKDCDGESVEEFEEISLEIV